MSKRTWGALNYQVKGPSAKRQTVPGGFIPRGVIYRQQAQVVPRRPRQRYVMRTPGGQITAENHYFESTRASQALTSTLTAWTGTEHDPDAPPNVNCLFAPTLGDENSQRTGRKTFLKSMRIRGRITIPAQTLQTGIPDAPLIVRVIVYQDMQTNAAQAQGEDVIAGDSATIAIEMFQNRANFGRFRVWKDKTFTLQNPAMTGTSASYEMNSIVREFKMTLKPKVTTNYNATNGGTIADIVDNSFHLIANCSSIAMAPVIQYRCRSVFTG